METGPSVRARRPTPTHSAADARRHTARPARPPPVPQRRDSAAAYPFQPLSFLSDSSEDDDDTADADARARPDPVERFGLPYQRDRPARPSMSPATPRASFSASSASSSTHVRTPGSLDSTTRSPLHQAHWREASVGGGSLQQAEWLAHVTEEMTASLQRLAENVRLAQEEMVDTRRVLEERRRKVLLASSASTESWSATAFDPSFQSRSPQVVQASQSADSYYSASPSFFASSTTASSLTYSEASTSTSPSYSSASYYSPSPSASTSHGSFS